MYAFESRAWSVRFRERDCWVGRTCPRCLLLRDSCCAELVACAAVGGWMVVRCCEDAIVALAMGDEYAE